MNSVTDHDGEELRREEKERFMECLPAGFLRCTKAGGIESVSYTHLELCPRYCARMVKNIKLAPSTMLLMGRIPLAARRRCIHSGEGASLIFFTILAQ